jgi:hypothetical protein
MSQIRNTVKKTVAMAVCSADMAVEVLGVAQQLNALQHAALQVIDYASSVLLVRDGPYALEYIGNIFGGTSVGYRFP